MQNISGLQAHVKAFLQKEFNGFYTFDLWKNVAAALYKTPNNHEALALINRFGEEFKASRLIVDVQASNDEWAPTLYIEYDWTFDNVRATFRVIFVKEKVNSVQLVDMFEAQKHFGDDYDYVAQFEKNVVLMNALRS